MMKTLLPGIALAACAAWLAGCATTHVGNVRSSGEGDSAAAWALLDSDNDGTLSVDELERQQAMGLLQDLPNADANGDRRISREEWDAWWPRMTDHVVRENGIPKDALMSAR
jgi:hypothetical protein